jgi:hypothetical protein
MTGLHPSVSLTDQLRAAAEGFRDAEIASTDDPLTIVKNLHATLEALRDAWPAVAKAASFEDPSGDEATEFTDDISRGLNLATSGLWDASNSI